MPKIIKVTFAGSISNPVALATTTLDNVVMEDNFQVPNLTSNPMVKEYEVTPGSHEIKVTLKNDYCEGNVDLNLIIMETSLIDTESGLVTILNSKAETLWWENTSYTFNFDA